MITDPEKTNQQLSNSNTDTAHDMQDDIDDMYPVEDDFQECECFSYDGWEDECDFG